MPGPLSGTRRALFGGGNRGYNGNGVEYLLLDTFTDTRPVGTVTGTAAVPGPGMRTVTDTNSKLSIAGGVASFATGGVGAGDPGLWYGAITRALGRVLLGRQVLSNTDVRCQFGWDTTAAGNLNDCINFDTSGNIAIFYNGAIVNVGTYAATTYDLALVLRASGVYYFVKGGAFTNWTLIWQSAAGSGATLPAIGTRSGGTTAVFTADNIRVPVPLYIPTPLAYSVFTQSDGPLTQTDALGPDAQTTPRLTWTGTTWATVSNVAVNTPNLGADVIVNGAFAADTDWNKGAGWTIAAGVAAATAASSDLTAAVAPLVVGTWYSVTYTVTAFTAGTVNIKLGTTAFPTHGGTGTFTETGLALSTAFAITAAGFTGSIDNVSCKPLTLSELFATISPSTADYLLDVNCTLVSATDGKQVGIVTNLNSAVSPTDFRLTHLDGRGNVIVIDWIAGTPTVKVTTAITYSAAATLRAILSGTALSPFYNGAASGAQQTMGANTNKLCGLFSTSPLSSLDVFQVFARGTSNEYSMLDQL